MNYIRIASGLIILTCIAIIFDIFIVKGMSIKGYVVRSIVEASCFFGGIVVGSILEKIK